MTSQAWMLVAFFTLALFVLAWPVGKAIDVVLNGGSDWAILLKNRFTD